MKRFTLSLFMLLAFAGVTQAALNAGNYFIKSYNGKYLTENNASHTLICSDRLTNSYAQVWAVEVNGTNVSLCNLLTGRYIKGSTTTYQQWSTTPDIQQFTYAESSGNYTFAWSENWGMHCDGSNVTVGWYTSDDKSKWTLETADVDPTDLLNQRLAFATATADQLTTFFTTTACTELKSDYASMSDADLRSAMSALPTTVQDLAVKVKNNTWTTYAGWDKTEKTFRVADYKAYSSGDRWTGIIGYSHHFGRLSNPTGIYADAGDLLQVYVGDIPDGETVKLEVAGYGQAAGQQYDLHEGMNALLIAAPGNCFVFYEVDNTTNGSAPYTPIANYAPVTVHIEGGTVQGCFDLTRGFTDTDFAAMKVYLMTKETVCLKSTTHVFNLYRDLLVSALGAEMKVEEMMAFWSGTAKLEDDLCARSDFDSYCNNVYSVTGHAGSGNPNATTYGTNYFEAAYSGLFNIDQLKEKSGGLWTIAHEQGHNRQKLIQLIGTTEISNNMFSNAAMDWQGRYTSRVLSLQTTFDFWQQGLSWLERLNNKTNDYHLWETLHLYVQLYQYFHQAGNDPKFFPKLFRAFRSSPMTLRAGTPVPATEDYLKFYQTCCDVAQVDLTEFFEVYGFFTLPPRQDAQTINGVSTGNYYQVINDYSTYYVYVNQSMIDAAKASVAAKNYPKCNIIFIEDRVTAPLATYEGHADGEVRKTYDGNAIAEGVYGDVGQYTDFGVTPGTYTFNVSERGNVTVSGTGAVGFKLYDASGNLVGVYNTTTFSLPAAAFDENGLKSGYTLQAAAGDGTAAAMTKDEGIVVNEFPKTGIRYTLSTPKRNSRYVTSGGSAAGLVSTETATPGATMQWQFVLRSGETETFDIVNTSDGSYIDPSTASSGAQLSTSAAQPSAGWRVTAVGTTGLYTVCSGNAQLHIANWGNNYNVLNYGGGSNTTDDGCLFAVEPVDDLSTTALAELDGLNIAVAAEAAADIMTGQWYVMFDRGAYHGYLYEKATSHTLYNTNTVPSGTATEAARYLVRLVQAPGDGMYYLQTGFGNYFWDFKGSTAVATTAYPTSRIKVDKIAGTDGHFYLQCVNNSVVLDANVTTSGDATVVGYGSTVPTATGGNNDWAFYPVTFTCPVRLNASGYATFAGPYAADYSSDSPFSAWQVTEVNGEAITFSQITEQAAAGTGVLLKGEAGTTVNIALTNLNDGTDYSATNQLVGITTPTAITAGTYYGLSGNTFVRVNLGTVPARKALLPAGVVNAASGVKALTFVFNDADGIEAISNEEIVNSNSLNSKCYSLSGQRLTKPQRGINIVDGKKVVVK